MSKMKNVAFFDQNNESLIEISLSEADADRALTDVVFATELLNKILEKQQDPQPGTKKQNEDTEYVDTVENEPPAKKRKETASDFVQVHDSNNEDTETDESSLTDRDESPVTVLESTGSLYRWSEKSVLLLLQNYRAAEEKFSSGKHSNKKIWENIAETMSNEGGLKLTGPQCAGKLRSLKKTYKHTKDHNNESGNNRQTWQYFKIMEDIFAKNAWCSPVAIASSSGLSVTDVEKSATTVDSGCELQDPSTAKTKPATSLFVKRLQQKEEHEEAKKKDTKNVWRWIKKCWISLEKLQNKSK